MKSTKEFILKFTYSTEMVFDYLSDNWITFENCVKTYGEDVARYAMNHPGQTVRSSNLSPRDTHYIQSVERMIKS